MEQEFYRIKRLPPYVFAEVNDMRAKARAEGEDIIDFGMGNPDSGTPPHIVEKLIETVQNPRTHRYSNSRGIPGLRRAIAAYYQRRFGVDLDPKTETLVTLGSKEGFANLATAITGSGDVIVVPNPSYPIHAYGFIIAGAALRHIPVGPDVDFMAKLERAVKHSVPPPSATMFAWAAIPQQYSHLGSLEFSKLLLSEAKVAVSPGLGFGEYGEGFVRFALVENRHRIRQAARNIRKFLSHAGVSPSGAQEQELAQ